MILRPALLALVALGCGDHVAAVVDAGPAEDAVPVICTATFAGNFAELSSSAEPCATLDDRTLTFAIRSETLDGPLVVAITLGAAPTAGAYSSTTSQTWRASGARMINHNSCVFSAGSGVVPNGNFTLTVTTIDGTIAHGSLDAFVYVLAPPFTNCGHPTTETVALSF